MDRPTGTQPKLPSWLLEAFEGELTDPLPNKRSEPRHIWVTLVFGKAANDPDAPSFPVKTYNASRSGVGLITRKPLPQGQILEISPEESLNESVRVRVVHCTQTIQGYRIGCIFLD